MFKKIILASLMASVFNTQAEKNISYSYVEIDYQYIDFDEGNANGLTLSGALDLSKAFYLGGFFNRNNVDNFNLNQYGLFLGFHKAIFKRTDFYSELTFGNADIGVISPFNGNRIKEDSNTYALEIGTRTAFTKKFELISRFGYGHNDWDNDTYHKFGLTGLFKFNDNKAITAGIENIDGDIFAASIGYRYSF